jgi:hypothetical protein
LVTSSWAAAPETSEQGSPPAKLAHCSSILRPLPAPAPPRPLPAPPTSQAAASLLPAALHAAAALPHHPVLLLTPHLPVAEAVLSAAAPPVAAASSWPLLPGGRPSPREQSGPRPPGRGRRRGRRGRHGDFRAEQPQSLKPINPSKVLPFKLKHRRHFYHPRIRACDVLRKPRLVRGNREGR